MLGTERTVAQRQTDNETRRFFSDELGVDHVLVDQLRHEILPRHRYDEPFAKLTDETTNPIAIYLHPDGSAEYSHEVHILDKRRYGDCVALCFKLLADPWFCEWWDDLNNQTRLDTEIFLLRGQSPNYFIYSVFCHFWLSIRAGQSRKSMVVDPSFQTISMGSGYRAIETDTQKVDSNFTIPSGGTARHNAGRYRKAPNGSVIFSREQVTSQHVLGLAPNGKVLLLGFGIGESKLDPVLPVAGLLDKFGSREYFFRDPVKGIIEDRSKLNPSKEDTEVLKKFFEISEQFQYRIR